MSGTAARPAQRRATTIRLQLLRGCWLLTASLACGQVGADGAAGHTGVDRPAAEFAQQVLDSINARRANLGLIALQPDPALTAIAQRHSQALAERGRLSHDGFAQRFDQASRDVCVENLAAGLLQAEALVAAWQQSPTHAQNLVAPRVRWAGVASTQRYVVFFACD